MKIVLANIGEGEIGVYVDGKFLDSVDALDGVVEALEIAGFLDYQDIDANFIDGVACWPETIADSEVME